MFLPSNRYPFLLEQVHNKVLACGRKAGDVTLITVTKNREIEAIKSVYNSGARDFGENRVQEGLPKIPLLPADVHWHFIGTLQSNKVAKVLPHFCLIHSVDSLELACRISRLSMSINQVTPILLQVNTSFESTKHGLTAEAWERCLDEINSLSHIQVQGLMTLAPFTQDQFAIRRCFRNLFLLREKWIKHMKNPEHFNHLSMGMSNDYLIAIEEGTTLLRIGTAIFET